MKRITLIFLFALINISLFSQNVGVNTTGAIANASAMLDVDVTNKGMLIPRIALTATTDVTTITSPANSLLIYNTATAGVPSVTQVTPGYYYYSTAAGKWIRVLNDGDAWLTTGNYLGANGVFGTLTNFSVILASNSAARGAMVNTGEFFINPALAYFNGDMFSSYATGTQMALNAYMSGTGAGNAGYFQNTSSSVNSGVADFLIGGASWGIWTDIQSTTNTHPAIAGVTRSMASTGVAGAVNGASTITILVGGSGGAFISPTTGVYATASNGTGLGGLFSGNGVAAGSPASGAGSASNGSAIGVYGSATTVASGTGGVFTGNNSGYITLAGGSGIAGTGTSAGVFGTGTNAASGTGGVFGGNNFATTTLGGGSGVAAIGNTVGVFGISATTNNAGGGYFQNATGTSFAYVGYRNAGTDFKIIGGGAVSTIVKDLNDKPVTMFCPESPEVLFQDFGSGQLVNGKANISLDPVFAKNIKVDENNPLRVIIQLEGDCNGVYVSNKTADGFEVKELQNGQSNVKFTWFVSANRMDTKDGNGNVVSQFEDLRFPTAPEKQEVNQNQTINGEVIIHETREIHKESIEKKGREQKIQQ